MNTHARKAAYFLALSLIFTGCSSAAPEAEAVEQEVTVETSANEELGKTEAVDTSESEETPATETEEIEDNNVDEATVQGDSDIVDTDVAAKEVTTEVEKAVAEETKPVETEMTTKEEPRVEEIIVEEVSKEVVVETPVTEEPIAEKSAVEEAIVEEAMAEEEIVEEPIQEEPVVEEATGLTGTFSAKGNSYDDYGWKPSLSLTFENGTITNVNYDEINADGAKKSQDTGYLSYFNQQTGVKLDAVYKTLSKDLLAAQTPESIDSVSGATIASDNFVKLAKKIIADNQ